MKMAYNSKKEIIDIYDSKPTEEYFCISCGEKLNRKIGKIRQYFSHTINNGKDCEEKVENLIKLNNKKKNEIVPVKECDILDDLYNNYLNEDIPTMNGLTDEQQAIINSNEKRIKCVAKAGCAKTSTLYHYLKARPFNKKLYIVFNVNMAKEAKEKFGDIPNLDIKTNYSLAFKHEGFKYKDRLKNSLNIYDYCKLANVFAKKPQDFAMVEEAKEVYDLWLATNIKSFEEFFKYNKIKDNDIKRLVFNMWNNMKKIDSKLPITHAFYMKSWQLKSPDLSKDYDLLAVDELQDVSESLADIIINSKVDTIIGVFDPKQELYSFANPRSGAELLGDEYKTYPLSYCFRIGNTLADLCSTIFEYLEMKPFKYIGMNKNQRIVEKIDTSKKHYVIFRSNFAILMAALDCIEEGKVFSIEGRTQLNYDFSKIESIYNFKYLEEKALFLKRFTSYSQMKEILLTNSSSFDMELISAINIVEKLGEDTLTKLNTLKEKIVDKEKADVIFSTVHQSKGLTIKEPVIIGNDFISVYNTIGDNIETKVEKDYDLIKYDLFILYVALTRACGEIQLNNDVINFYIEYVEKFRK